MTKKIILFTLTTLFLSCNSSKKMLSEKQNVKDNFINVSNHIDNNEFEKIKNFILGKGDKMTFRNIDNNNPHYRFKTFDVFLGAIGQGDINNNPEISNFYELTIADWKSDIRYYRLIIVRKTDLKVQKRWIQKGMKEKQVYLVDIYDKGLDVMKNNLSNYLNQIREEIKATNRVDGSTPSQN